MEITKKERLLLINQFEILKIINPEEKKHFDELIDILSDGYKIFYTQLEEWLSDDMPQEEGRFVLDILSLYRAIENYKIKHEDNEINNHVLRIFRGFDGNEEGQYYGFMKFLIDKQEKFQEQQQYSKETDGFNSHWPMVEKYKNMVAKWIELGQKYELTGPEILVILNSANE